MYTLYIAICEYGAEEELCEQLLILIPPDSSQPPTAALLLIHRTPILITNKHCTTLHQCTSTPMPPTITKLNCTNAINNDKCIAHQFSSVTITAHCNCCAIWHRCNASNFLISTKMCGKCWQTMLPNVEHKVYPPGSSVC